VGRLCWGFFAGTLADFIGTNNHVFSRVRLAASGGQSHIRHGSMKIEGAISLNPQ